MKIYTSAQMKQIEANANEKGYAYMVLRISDEAAFLKATENSDIRLVGSAELGIV